MKRMHFLMILGLVLSVLLAACGGGAETPAAAPEALTVTDGDSQQSFTLEALQALPQTTATFNGTDYVGVTLMALLDAAEIDPAALAAVKAVATDGYSVEYEPALFQRDDVILAYGLADGPLTADDGVFRMVLPGEEGKLNVRMVAGIEVVR